MSKVFRHTNQKLQDGIDAEIGFGASVGRRRGPFVDGATPTVLVYESDRNLLNSPTTVGPTAITSITGTAPDMVVHSGAGFTADMVGRWVTIAGSGGNDGTFLVTSFISGTALGYYDASGVAAGAGGTWTTNTFNFVDPTGEIGRLVKVSGTPPTAGAGPFNSHDDDVYPIIEVLSGQQVRLGGGCRWNEPSIVAFTFRIAALVGVQMKTMTLRGALGEIRVPLSAAFVNGELLTITRFGMHFIFEFNTVAPTNLAHIWIDTTSAASAGLQTAIDACTPLRLRTIFLGSGPAGTIDLVDQFAIAGDPVSFSDTVASAAFETLGPDALPPSVTNQYFSFPNVVAAHESMKLVPLKHNVFDERDLTALHDWSFNIDQFPGLIDGITNAQILSVTGSRVVLEDTTGGGPFTADMVGQHVRISSGVPGNNGLFRIEDLLSATQIVYFNDDASVEGPGTFRWCLTTEWFLHDRQAFNHDDLYRLYHDAALEAGLNVIGQSGGSMISCVDDVAGSLEGNVVVIWDGSKKSVFEFDVGGGGVAAGHHAIVIAANDTATSNAAALTATINASRSLAAATAGNPCGLLAVNVDEFGVAGAGPRVKGTQLPYAYEGYGAGNGASGLTIPAANLVEITQASATPFPFNAAMATDGQYITISGASNPANNGRFIVDSVTSTTVLRYINTAGVAQAGFAGRWESKAWQADANEAIVHDVADPEFVVSGIAGGKHPGQNRGRDNPFTTIHGGIHDTIYFSPGEAERLEELTPRRWWLRFTQTNLQPNSIVTTTALNKGFDWAAWQTWDPFYANNPAGFTRGNGSNPVRAPHARGGQLYAASANQAFVANVDPAWGADRGLFFGNNAAHLANYGNTLGIPGGDPMLMDYCKLGDRDEFQVMVWLRGAGAYFMGIGNIQEINQNPRRFMLRTAVLAGASAELNIGPYNPQTMSRPYIVGDRIQLAGAGVAGATGTGAAHAFPDGGGFIESTTITGFGIVAGSDPAFPDYFVRVANLNKAHTVGTIIGEEACPLFTYMGPHATFGAAGATVLHNSANFGDATYDDWAGIGTSAPRGYGFSGEDGSITTDTLEFDPNQQSGKFGALPLLLRQTLEGEFRGRLRYLHHVSVRAGAERFGKDGVDFYYVGPLWTQQTAFNLAFGPMPAALAGTKV